MRDANDIKQSYHCAKCRNSTCVVHHVTIPRDVFPLPVGRYLITTCSLCGYTEFFDQSVFEHNGSSVPAKTTTAAEDSGMEPS
ncbi:MAG: Nucleic-acid-binding protein containing Zn-ribbon domain [Candidatus Sumerlaeota bacterium]|nr:Nucleic-acid-binding protein containing Zn-ribbon domain [Candidatus Sumerlaeota bacterium]